MTVEDKRPRVFVSYAHDSDQHRQDVRRFAHFLRRSGGLDVRLDEWSTHERRDWSVWMIDQLRNADFVLVIASPAYKRRAEGTAAAADGRGVQFEAALLRDFLTMDRPTWVPKVLPVLLPGRSIDEIPVFLQPYSAGRYVVESLTIEGMDELYRVLTGQPRYPLPDMGQVLSLPPAQKSGELSLAEEQIGPGRSWVFQRSIGMRATGPVTTYWLHTSGSNAAVTRRRAVLLDVCRMLSATAAVPGVPRLLDHTCTPTDITLVVARTTAPSLRDLYFPPPLSATRVPQFVEAMHSLCRTLQEWHHRGFSHQALTPDSIVFVDGGRLPRLLDIGLAGTEAEDSEGPLTDVMQLGAIAAEALAGTPLSHRTTALLADAQSPVPRHRPRDASAFGTELRLSMTFGNT